MSNTTVRIKIDKDMRLQASGILALKGLTVEDAVLLFLLRIVADKELPFAIKAPNAQSRAAISEADDIIKGRRARFSTSDALIDDLEKTSDQ